MKHSITFAECTKFVVPEGVEIISIHSKNKNRHQPVRPGDILIIHITPAGSVTYFSIFNHLKRISMAGEGPLRFEWGSTPIGPQT